MHEHLDDFQLINMNGRVYDPLTAQFLSPDPYLQAPDNWLNYNRYGYAFGNPFKYTDPTGEWFGLDDLIAAAIGGVVNFTVNAFQGNIHSFGDGLAAFGAGAVAGNLALYGPAGWAAGGAIVGATNAYLGGGDIFHGAAIGVFSGLAGGSLGSLATNAAAPLLSSISSPVLRGAATGMVGGAAGGYAGGFTAGFLMTGNLAQANAAGLNGMIIGAGIGGAVGAGYGFKYAADNNLNPWTGRPNQTTMSIPNLNVPAVADPTLELQSPGLLPMSDSPSLSSTSENLGTMRIPNGEVPVHGNSLQSQRSTWGYKLYDNEGTFLKNGITSKAVAETRYTKTFMQTHYMKTFGPFPNRFGAYQWEYQQNVIQRGPWNLNMH
jgi:RHS repeat-associated protein